MLDKCKWYKNIASVSTQIKTPVLVDECVTPVHQSSFILEWILVIIVEERVQNVSQAGGESVRQAGTALKPIHNQVKVGEFNLYSPLQYKVRRSCAPSFILFDV